MKNKFLLITLAATLAILAFSAIAFSQPENSRWTEQGLARRVIARIESRLNITSEQRAQVKTILETEEPTIVILAAQAKEEREAMTALPAYDEAAVREVAQKYTATNTNIVIERAKIRLELRAVLTPQQLQQLEEFESGMDGRFDERLTMMIGQI
jgi:Spy/CpxP family protein refolding chaperone